MASSESGTPPGIFLGGGLAGLADGIGVATGSAVSEEHLFQMLGMCADPATKEAIYACHRQAIDIVLAYAESEVFHSRSGTDGVEQEDIAGVVAAAFTQFDSRAGDLQLHDHVLTSREL